MIVFLVPDAIAGDLDHFLQLGDLWIAEVGANKDKAAQARARFPRRQITTYLLRGGSLDDQLQDQLASILEHYPTWAEIRIVRHA